MHLTQKTAHRQPLQYENEIMQIAGIPQTKLPGLAQTILRDAARNSLRTLRC